MSETIVHPLSDVKLRAIRTYPRDVAQALPRSTFMSENG